MEIRVYSSTSLISLTQISDLARATFGDMVKAVVDLQKRQVVIGGEMHSDGEAELLALGSSQSDLWGFNIYPKTSGYDIEYTSLINIRPAHNNRSMEVLDEGIKSQINQILEEIVKL